MSGLFDDRSQKLAQREGEQRQRVLRLGVARGLLHERVFDARAPATLAGPSMIWGTRASGMGPSENSSNRAVSAVAD